LEDLVTRNGVFVAPVQAEDVEDLMELWSSARQEAGSSRIDPTGTGRDMHRVLRDALDRHSFHAFLARHDGRPVGYLIASAGPLLPLVDTPAVCIEQLFVHRDARHKGTGTALISACATLAERVGAEQVADHREVAGPLQHVRADEVVHGACSYTDPNRTAINFR
jgi:GNAT superfamily N-acetyltransferase